MWTVINIIAGLFCLWLASGIFWVRPHHVRSEEDNKTVRPDEPI